MTLIASALHRELGSTHAAIKTAAGWTDTNERTVKNWFSGRSAPSGHHLVALLGRSDEVLRTVLMLAGREEMMVARHLVRMRADLWEVLAMMDRIFQTSRDPEIQTDGSNDGR